MPVCGNIMFPKQVTVLRIEPGNSNFPTRNHRTYSVDSDAILISQPPVADQNNWAFKIPDQRLQSNVVKHAHVERQMIVY